ncbi:hypothetical protein GA0070215_10753 [Micromonospora marina]|uniref:Uncharacterized protein n=1 Tax=Micromonospora marina TaxID=307120 RepID=A0A1C4XCG0_9ACTN|nr:hypothetical protein GA0070215_10753 [Micromonospora marina]
MRPSCRDQVRRRGGSTRRGHHPASPMTKEAAGVGQLVSGRHGGAATGRRPDLAYVLMPDAPPVRWLPGDDGGLVRASAAARTKARIRAVSPPLRHTGA